MTDLIRWFLKGFAFLAFLAAIVGIIALLAMHPWGLIVLGVVAVIVVATLIGVILD